MTKKSKWIAVIAVVLIITCMATLFVACDKEEKPAPPPAPPEPPTFAEAMTQVTTGLFATTGDATLLGQMGTNLKLEVTTTEGDKTEKYTVDFNLGLDLFNSFTKGEGANKIGLVVKDSKGAVVFRIAYDNSAKGWEERMILQTADAKYAVKVPNVAATIKGQFEQAGIKLAAINGVNTIFYDKDNDGQPDPNTTKVSDDDIRTVFETTIPDIIPMAGEFVGKNLKMSKESISFDFEISNDTLAALSPILSGFNTYVDAMGLGLDLAKLGEVLPKIVVTPSFTFDANGALTSINVDASIGEKNIVIPHAGGSTNFAELTIPSDLGLSIKANMKMVAPSALAVDISDIDTATKINAINLKLNATLEVKKAINMGKIAIIELNVPADTYDISVNASIDPTQLIGVNFAPDGKFSLDNLLNALFGKLEGGRVSGNAIDFLDIQVTGQNTKTSLVNIKLDVTNNKAAIAALGLELPQTGVTGLIDFIKGLLPKTANEPALAAEEEATDTVLETLKTLAPTIKNIMIKLNQANGLNVTMEETKYATWIANPDLPGGGEFDINKQWLSVAAKASLKDSLVIEAQVKNGGTIFDKAETPEVVEGGNIDIDVKFTLPANGIQYGTAVRPTFN